MPDVAPGIITNGLGSGASSMILGHFHLGFFEGTIVIPPPRRGGGGAGIRPFDLDNKEDYPPQQKIEVKIKVRVGQMWHERTYWVLPKDASIVVKIFNMINTTTTRVKIALSGLQPKMKDILANISNITNKSDKE